MSSTSNFEIFILHLTRYEKIHAFFLEVYLVLLKTLVYLDHSSPFRFWLNHTGGVFEY